MSDIHIERNHNFDFQTARTKAKDWLAHANQEFGLSVDYQEGDGCDIATIKKSGVEAKATLTADKIVFEATLGFLGKPFKSVITSGIENGLSKYFA